VEHWTNAVEQAQIAALAMLGLSPEVATDPIPYFWSDQFGVKLQFVGSSYRARNAVTVDGGSSRSATVYADGDVATGALTWNWPTAAGRVKKLLRTPTTVDSITERLRADAAPDPAGRLTRSP
jgi:NADPH-dependent 2,4-dienoyl-CoA reductase/sulfur reductase-like enzyme